MKMPGKEHFKAVLHLLHWLRCNHNTAGITFFSSPSQSPLHRMVAEHADPYPESPIMLFTDASWQDCPDTSRSTGCYAISMMGGFADLQSFLLTPVAMSSAESEYNTSAQGTMAFLHVLQVWNEALYQDPDKVFHVPLFMDLQSTLAMIKSNKDTKLTCHIQHCFHFVQQNCSNGCIVSTKIEGELNPADVGTRIDPNKVSKDHSLQILQTKVQDWGSCRCRRSALHIYASASHWLV